MTSARSCSIPEEIQTLATEYNDEICSKYQYLIYPSNKLRRSSAHVLKIGHVVLSFDPAPGIAYHASLSLSLSLDFIFKSNQLLEYSSQSMVYTIYCFNIVTSRIVISTRPPMVHRHRRRQHACAKYLQRAWAPTLALFHWRFDPIFSLKDAARAGNTPKALH